MSAAGASPVSGIKVAEDPMLSQAPTPSHRSKQAQKSVVADFCALSDGSLVEVVAGEDRAKSKLNLLIWNAEKVSLVDQFEQDGCVYTPPALDEEILKNLNLGLPSGVKACPTPAEFFNEVSQLIRSHVDLPEASVRLVAAFALSTWFVEKLAVAPYLWICGPPGSGKTTLLRLLHCLCRRSVLIAGNIPSWVYPLPALLRPTLLLDELRLSGTQQSHALQCWLRAGNARGVPVTVGGRLVDGFGAKVLCSRQPPSDSALASRAWHISMIPSHKDLAVLDEETVQRIGDDFQARLLMFRLQHYREFRPESIDNVTPLGPRMRDMMRALLLPLRDVKEFLTVFDALEEQFLQAVDESAHEPEALVTLALVSFCHDEESSPVFVGQIANRVNESRRKTGEEGDLKPRAVGAILKSLGLRTETLGSFGRGLRLTDTVKRRIHRLLQSYHLSSRTSGCALCEETMRADGAEPPRSGASDQR